MKKEFEEKQLLKKIIELLKNEDLYTVSLYYDWDENPYEVYEPFNIEDFVNTTKKQIIEENKQKRKTIKKRR